MMKKILSLAAVLALALSLAACGSAASSSSPAGSTAATPDIADATTLLTEIWNAHTDDQKFSVTGGDYDNMVDDAPGKVNPDNGDTMNNLFGFPADMADKVDDAASLMHMMNANTFTAAAYHVADSSELDNLTSALRDSIQSRQWMCGFPDKLVILTVGDYVVAEYGATDLCDTFKDYAVSLYPSAKVVYDEAIQ